MMTSFLSVRFSFFYFGVVNVMMMGFLLLGCSCCYCCHGLRPAALVTGSTDGIGMTTAKHLAAKGYVVLLHGRNEQRLERAQTIVNNFVGNSDCTIRLPAADLSTVDGCVQLTQSVLKTLRTTTTKHQTNNNKNDNDNNIKNDNDLLSLKILMNNAGVFAESRIITSEGLEQTFAVNVMAPFVITSLLLPHMLTKQQQSSSSPTTTTTTTRIVTASSISQCANIRDWNDLTYEKRRYSAHSAYSESKLLDAMLTMEMSERLEQVGLAPHKITCNCLDPGTVNTKMLLAGWGPCGIDVETALDQTWLCTSSEVEGVTGKYYTYQNERPAARSAYNPKERQQLWSMLSKLAPDAASIWDFDWLHDEHEH